MHRILLTLTLLFTRVVVRRRRYGRLRHARSLTSDLLFWTSNAPSQGSAAAHPHKPFRSPRCDVIVIVLLQAVRGNVWPICSDHEGPDISWQSAISVTSAISNSSSVSDVSVTFVAREAPGIAKWVAYYVTFGYRLIAPPAGRTACLTPLMPPPLLHLCHILHSILLLLLCRVIH